MFKNFFVICSLLVSALLFTTGCSTKSNDSSNGGEISNGDSAASIANADSFFLLSGATAAQLSVASSVAVSESGVNRDYDNDDDDEDGSVLYYSDDNGTSKELFFNVNGIRNRGYVDDLIYAGENWLLAEIEGFRTVSENGTLTGRFREDERYVLINITDGSMKDLPANQMRACGGDIELFEVVGGNGYAICEDAAYKIDLTAMAATPIGTVGHDQYDDSAVVVFADGTVLAVNGASATSNTSAFINKPVPTVTFGEPISYAFIQVPAVVTGDLNGVVVNGTESRNYQSPNALDSLKADLSNSIFMGSYYYDQLKFLFGDMRYEQDDGQFELELLNTYGASYNFINFKDKASKIYTLSLEDNFTTNPYKNRVGLAEISVDANGKIIRNMVSDAAVADNVTGFSGVLVNRKDSTSRHLDLQHAFDDKSYYTINMVEKTVTATAWNVSPDDLSAMKTTVRRPGSGSTRNSVYYGEEGIAFILNNMVKHVKYEAGAEAKEVAKPASCTNPNNVSVDGSIVYYNCGRDTYMVDMAAVTPNYELFSSKGKVIGNIIEVKNKRR